MHESVIEVFHFFFLHSGWKKLTLEFKKDYVKFIVKLPYLSITHFKNFHPKYLNHI